MRILLQNSTFYPHAHSDAELAVARGLSALGHRVDVLATTGRRTRSAPHLAHQLARRTVEGVNGTVFEATAHGHLDLLDPLDSGGAAPSRLRRVLHRWSSRRSARWRELTRGLLESERPDLLHTHGLEGMTVSVWRAAMDCAVPIVHTLRDDHLIEVPARRATSSVACVIAPSRFLLDRHLECGLFAGVRAEIVPDACGPAVEPMPRRDTPHVPRAVYRGPLTVEHGVGLLLDVLKAWFEDPQMPPLNVAFVGAGPLEVRVRSFCSSWSKRAGFHGSAEGAVLDRLLRESDVAVVAPLAAVAVERAIADAFCYALPVVGSRRGAIAEWIEDKGNGTLVEPEPRALRSALADYARDADRRLAHGAAAHACAGRRRIEDQVASLLSIYRELEAEVAR